MRIDKILGYQDREIKIHIEDSFNSESLYVIYPGYNYGFNQPYFYYLVKLLTEKRQDFIFVDLDWVELNESTNLPFNEALTIMKYEIDRSFEFLNQFTNKNYIMIAKSLGTVAIEHAKLNSTIHSKTNKYIWLTPFRNTSKLLNINLDKDIIYVGDKDPFFDNNIYERLNETSHVHVLTGLDHSFDIKGDAISSINSISYLMKLLIKDLDL